MTKTINDAKTDSIVSLYGTPWRVIGYSADKAAMLERVGCEEMPVNNRTHHTVILGSLHSSQFKLSCVDQQGVSEPLHGAETTSAPVDHGPAAGAREEAGDFVPCERTVLACIAAIDDGQFPAYIYKGEIDAKLKALLPKKDREEVLVEAVMGENAAFSRDQELGIRYAVKRLLAQGEIRG